MLEGVINWLFRRALERSGEKPWSPEVRIATMCRSQDAKQILGEDGMNDHNFRPEICLFLACVDFFARTDRVGEDIMSAFKRSAWGDMSGNQRKIDKKLETINWYYDERKALVEQCATEVRLVQSTSPSRADHQCIATAEQNISVWRMTRQEP